MKFSIVENLINSESGSIQIGNILIQFGTETGVWQNRTVTLPRAYSSTNYAFICVHEGGGGVHTDVTNCSISRTTNRSVLINKDRTNGAYVHWIAIGRV